MKSHAEMYVIHKFIKDPNFEVKSEKYTEGELMKIDEFFPKTQLINVEKSGNT